MNIQKLDLKAKNIAEEYKKAEVKLIEVLEELDQYKAYYKLGYPSLFKYCIDALKLSPEVTAIYINVARKTREVPKLKEAIKTGAITVSKARRMTSVLNKKNQDHWLQVASIYSKQKLEREVAIASPRTAVREQLNYVSSDSEVKEKASVLKLDSKEARIQLQVGLSEKAMLKLRRAQEVLSQKRKRPVSLEECLETMTEFYLDKTDPLEVAKRQKIRGKLINVKNQIPQARSQKMVEIKTKSKNQTRSGDKAESTTEAKTGAKIKMKAEDKTNPKTSNASAKQTVPGHGSSRAQSNKKLTTSNKASIQKAMANNIRVPIPAHIKHQVHLKYQGQCGHNEISGNACSAKSFLEIHHKTPVYLGGDNSLENLILLCHGHHKIEHLSTRSLTKGSPVFKNDPNNIK